MRNSRTLTQNAATSLGSDSQKIGPLKNVSWTRGQPGALTTTYAEQPEDDDRRDDRDQQRSRRPRPPRPSAAAPAVARAGGTDRGRLEPARRVRARVATAQGWKTRGVRACPASHSCVIACELAGRRRESADGLVDAVGQRAVLVEHDAEVLARRRRRRGTGRRSTPSSNWTAVM